ncbi:protein-L-isoaspartate(D-aspartate) O-methyltransferase [Flagellimonas sp. 2504JD4-2]
MCRIIIITLCVLFAATASFGQTDFTTERMQMVDTQIKARGVYDFGTLYAMLNVPRHEFVPENIQQFAYYDRALPIGKGQTISQPYIVAFMTQSLKLKSNYKVLEIGTGSGYQAAVLSKVVDAVFTIEIVEDLALSAEKRLKRLGYTNVKVKRGDGYNGWPKEAPFDAIMVTAGAEYIPQPLVDQLKVGGRMIIPVGPHNGVRQLVLIHKKKNKIVKKDLMAVRFVPFTREE